MKKIFKTIDENIEQVDKRIDNRLTLIGIFLVFIVSKGLGISLVFFIFLIIGLLLIRSVWDIVHIKSRERKRYRQTLSIALTFLFLAGVLWFVVRILLPYPFGILYS